MLRGKKAAETSVDASKIEAEAREAEELAIKAAAIARGRQKAAVDAEELKKAEEEARHQEVERLKSANKDDKR